MKLSIPRLIMYLEEFKMKFFYQLDKVTLNDFQAIGPTNDTRIFKNSEYKDKYEQCTKMTIVMDNVTLKVVTLGVSELILENIQ